MSAPEGEPDTATARLDPADEVGEAGLVLVAIQGGEVKAHPLPRRGVVRLGRSDSNDVVLADPTVSRHHATLSVEGGTMVLTDLGGANPARLRQTELTPHQPVVVRLGDGIELGKVVVLVHRAAMGAAAATALASAEPAEIRAEDELVLGDAAMDRLWELARRVAASELPVIIEGETGVGKERLARFVHAASRRRRGPLVPLHGASLTEERLDAELFGHVRGAFSGATTARRGLLEAASGGTLLLDDVNEIPLVLQPKLLRALQDRSIRPLGGVASRPIDVRVICTSREDLAALVDAGRFRADLYYRLHGITLTVPPLRARRSAIRPLAEAFVRKAEGQPLSDDVVKVLEGRDYPGNVRELEASIQRALVLAAGRPLEVAHLEVSPIGDAPSPPLARAVDEFERARVIEALAAEDGNQTRAARRLGIGRRSLIERIERYGLPRPRKDR